MRRIFFALIAVQLLLAASQSYAKGLYFDNNAFLNQAFGDQPYKSEMLWIKGENKAILQKIFGRKSVGLRQRYWHNGQRTAWVFNEIGKELPITIGVVVEKHQIAQLHVMEYRESRGGEVRHAFFTRQFLGSKLDSKKKLSNNIDGITGATLSVRSMKRVARAALYLHGQITGAQENP